MSEYDYARAQCPTCGTPGFAQDRSGDDELEIPPEVVERGVTALRNSLKVQDDVARDVVVDIFRAMQRVPLSA